MNRAEMTDQRFRIPVTHTIPHARTTRPATLLFLAALRCRPDPLGREQDVDTTTWRLELRVQDQSVIRNMVPGSKTHLIDLAIESDPVDDTNLATGGHAV
jgi:hypothetical protein